jgi:hypothetical protein
MVAERQRVTAGGGVALEKIQPDGCVFVGRIEVHHIIGAVRGNVVQQIGGKVAMGIDDRDAFTGLDILKDQIPQQRCLAGAGFAKDIQVMASVSTRKSKRLIASPAKTCSDVNEMIPLHIFPPKPCSAERETAGPVE